MTEGKWEGRYWTRGDTPTLESVLGPMVEGDGWYCQCCGADDVALKVYEYGADSRPWVRCREENKPPYKALCEICAGTMIGVWDDYSHQHDHDTLEVMKMIALVGNMILSRLPKP